MNIRIRGQAAGFKFRRIEASLAALSPGRMTGFRGRESLSIGRLAWHEMAHDKRTPDPAFSPPVVHSSPYSMLPPPALARGRSRPYHIDPRTSSKADLLISNAEPDFLYGPMKPSGISLLGLAGSP